MHISSVSNVVIEITRRCNMCCAHCIRGDAENVDIQERYIDAFLDSFDKGACISSIVFSGGEISLNIPAIRYILKAVKERNISVGSFYMVTNGKAVDKMADLLSRVLSGGITATTRTTICAAFVSAATTSTRKSRMKVQATSVA